MQRFFLHSWRVPLLFALVLLLSAWTFTWDYPSAEETLVARFVLQRRTGGTPYADALTIPPASRQAVDVPSTPGTYTYQMVAEAPDGSHSLPSNEVTVTSAASTSPEYWATLAQDGNRRASSPTSLQGTPVVRWVQTLTGFPEGDVTSEQTYQRSAHLMIREGRVAVLVPSLAPESVLSQGRLATIALYDLRTGMRLSSTLTPHVGAGGLYIASRRGIMDSDTPGGLVTGYWGAEGITLAHGGDHSGMALFDPVTGERPFGQTVAQLGGINGSGYFAMTQALPGFYARGGALGHNLANAGAALGYRGMPLAPLVALKMYAGTLLHGAWAYPTTLTNVQVPPPSVSYAGYGQGVAISAHELVGPPWTAQKRWTYTDSTKTMVNQGANHAYGGLRAYAVSDDHLYFVGYRTQGSGSTQKIDPAKGFVLTGVPLQGSGATRTADIEIPLPLRTDEGNGTNYTASIQAAVHSLPQLALLGEYAVVFQPQQSRGVTRLAHGHVWIVHLPTRKLTAVDFPPGYFTTNTVPSLAVGGRQSPERGVQLVLAGDSAYVVAPTVTQGLLSLTVERIVLATGTRTTTTHALGDLPVPASDGRLALRDLAAVDGRLVALVDVTGASQLAFDAARSQALVVLEGDQQTAREQRPVAVMSAPITGGTLVAHKSDLPLPPTNQVDSGVPLAYSAAGSFDPDGGALTYHWDFGDGTTSSEVAGEHMYAAIGEGGSLTPYTLTLTVTDSAGQPSLPVTRELVVRNVGTQQRLTLPASADAWVWLQEGYSTPNTKNHGAESVLMIGNRYLFDQKPNGPKKTYLRFVLPPWTITDATLRVYATSWASYTGYGDYKLQAHLASNDWEELTLVGLTAPPPGDVIGQHQIVPDKYTRAIGVWVDIPITAALQGLPPGPVTLVLDAWHPTTAAAYPEVTLSSREGAHPPALVLLGTPGQAVSQPPTITQQPESLTLPMPCVGPATFTMQVSGTPPLAIQWTRDGIPIPGATGLTLSKPCVTTEDAGSYGCTVSNAMGQAQCDAVVLTVP